jgi:hypothetical protein
MSSILYKTIECRVADPLHFNVNPDPSFHFTANPDPTFQFNADPDLAPHQSDDNLRPLVHRPTMGSILSLYASFVSVSNSPWLHFEPLKLLNFDFYADPNPAFHLNGDDPLK